MEAIVLEPKNKKELDAIKETLKHMGIRSFSVSNENKKYLESLKIIKMHSEVDLNDPDVIKKMSKEERIQLARYNLSTLALRNHKATASMELINEVLHEIRKSKNGKKKN